MVIEATLRDLVESSGLSFRKNTVSYIFDCPRCSKEKLYVRRRDARFICWVCASVDGWQGRGEYALADLLSLPVSVVRERLYGSQYQSYGTLFLDPQLVDFFGEDDFLDEDADEIPTIPWPWDYYPIDHQHAARGVAYLATRGIPLDLALQYGLRYCPTRRRVAFPVEIEGRLVGYQERTVLATTAQWSEELDKLIETPKVLSSKGIPREHLCMFSDRMRGSDHVVLCEGPIDAMKADLCQGNVCTMGKKISRGQIALIRQNGIRKVYLALDPDAWEETARLVRDFSDLEVFLMEPPAGKKDLGEMTLPEVHELFLAAPALNPTRLNVWLRPF